MSCDTVSHTENFVHFCSKVCLLVICNKLVVLADLLRSKEKLWIVLYLQHTEKNEFF